MPVFVIIIVVALVLVPNVIKWCFYSEFLQTLADKDFVCPNCGCRFHAKWYQMIFKRISVDSVNSAVLRCPICHKRDMCHIAHDKL